MKGIPKGRYTREFRQEAVKLAVEDKISCREAAQRLSLAPSTLSYWVKAYKEGKLGEIGKTQKPRLKLCGLQCMPVALPNLLSMVDMPSAVIPRLSCLVNQSFTTPLPARALRNLLPLPRMMTVPSFQLKSLAFTLAASDSLIPEYQSKLRVTLSLSVRA